MDLFKIDKNKCRSDGICADECPIGIIQMNARGEPCAVQGAAELCINCGHCVAVCPYGAFSHAKMESGHCPALPAGWELKPEQVEYLLKGRRSIRTYQNKFIERKVIEKMINIASFAPSGINRQPVRWAVLDSAEKVRHLSKLVVDWMRGLIEEQSPLAAAFRMQSMVSMYDKGRDRICRGAPHIIVAYAIKEDMTASQASTIALTYLELAAVSLGLGACWAGYVQMAINMCPQIQDFCGVPKRASCFGAMLIGHPKYRYHRIPLRDKPRINWV